MLELVSLFTLLVLFTMEFVLNLLAHALALRFAMCHTLVFVVFSAGNFFNVLGTRKRKAVMSLLRTKMNVGTFVTFLFAVAYVLLFGFVVVNILHSLQLLVHRHDMDVHHGLLVLLAGAADFLVKLFLWPLLDCGFHQKSCLAKLQKTSFYLTASILLIIIAALRCISSSYKPLILWLDPALTIVACATVCAAAFNPAKDVLFTLLLAAPRHVDIGQLSDKLRREFPEADIHELRLWRESRNSVVASLHVRIQRGEQCRLLMHQIHAFFHGQGIHRAIIQPEFEGDGSRTCILPCPCRKESMSVQ